MKIIKRNGAEATFDISKIIMAVTKANAAVEEGARMTPRPSCGSTARWRA